MGRRRGRLVWFAARGLPAGLEPEAKGEERSDEEKGPKDGPVVACQPERQVDVEVVGPFGGEAGGEISERAASPIGGQNGAFQKDEAEEGGRPGEVVQSRGDGDGYNAGDEKGPDGGVEEFDGDERADSLRGWCHKKTSIFEGESGGSAGEEQVATRFVLTFE